MADPLPKVLIAVPHMGWIHVDLVCAMMGWMSDARVDKRFFFNNAVPCENNRNQIAKRFLDSDCQWLITIDDDNVPLRNPIDLVIRYPNIDVIGIPCPLWQLKELDRNPFCWNFSRYGDETEDGLAAVDHVGTGCMIIRRKVLETIQSPFSSEWNPDGILRYGTDVAFCRRCKKAGFGVFIHTHYVCRHYKEIDLELALRCIRQCRAGGVADETIRLEADSLDVLRTSGGAPACNHVA